MADNFFPPLPADSQGEAPTAQNDGTTGAASGPVPPFPIVIPAFTSGKLKKGTWLFNFQRASNLPGFPSFNNNMDGTFRFDQGAVSMLPSVRGSGDMYRRATRLVPGRQLGGIWIPPMWLPGPAPPKNEGIPIFPIAEYEAYLRVTSVSLFLDNSNTSFNLEYQKYKWNAAAKDFARDVAGAPLVEETFVARMTWSPAPAGWTSPGDYLTGEVKIKSSGVVAGTLTMGWVSDKYRKIGLEIDAVRGCFFPAFNAARHSIWQLLEDAGFQIAKKSADENTIADVADSKWSEAEMHATMLSHRQRVDLEKEWTYHALVVPHYEDDNILGIMYDNGANDSNGIAREGFAVSAHLQTGSTTLWGDDANKKLQETQDSFVRTTIHELGHALGMHHPDVYDPVEEMDDTYQCQTRTLNQHARDRSILYNSVIQWRHSPAVQKRLRHYPDIRIRPGGVQFGAMGGRNGAAPWVPTDTAGPIPGLILTVEPLLRELPLGAPVRVSVNLRNDNDFPIEVPRNIGLGGTYMKGDVEDTAGFRRPFSSILQCVDEKEPLVMLEPGKSMTNDLTLFGGRDGPLFPSTGVHKITAILTWSQSAGDGGHVKIWLDTSTTVMVIGARSASHAAAAHCVLAQRETQLALVLAGDHLKDGNDVIRQACEDETLGPHFACIEARRYARRFMDRKPDVERAKKLIGRKGCVMSESEKRKLDRLCKSG